jgi:hypothetical protein
MLGIKQFVVAALFYLALAACEGTGHASPPHAIPTSICMVLSHPTDWNNKIVSVSASYYDDGIHGAVLADDHCANGVLQMTFLSRSTAQAGLNAAFPDDSLGTFDHATNGTWVGRFRSDYGKFHETFLEVRAITNLTVVPIDFSASDASPIHTTVDEIVNHPKQFDHKTVVLRSEYMSDGMHGSMVFDCNPNNDERGIRIRSTTGAKGQDTLDQALQQGYRGTIDKTIRAEWTGRLSWIPSTVSGIYEIQIIEVRNLTLSKHPNAVPCKDKANFPPSQ